MAVDSAKSKGHSIRRIGSGKRQVLVNEVWAEETWPEGASDTDLLNSFRADHWSCCEATEKGRGASWFVGNAQANLVLRQFRRGGALASILKDRYWFTRTENCRSFAEFKLLKQLHALGLPVPEPCVALLDRRGLFYRASLITRRIENSQSWSALLKTDAQQVNRRLWKSVGTVVARLHNAGVNHTDLNIHNILVDNLEQVFIIDFDKCEIRPEAAYAQRNNIHRLRRSLEKEVQDVLVIDRGWRWFESTYFETLSRS